MNTRFSRILFDYDGTLIIHDKENEGRQVASILGLDEEKIPEFERRLGIFFKKFFSVKNRKMTYDLFLKNLDKVIRPLESYGVSAKTLEEAIRENSMLSTTLASNAKETLMYLAERGYQICLFTNGFYDGQVENMKYKGIYDYFEKIYAWDDFYTKPDPRAFWRALAKTNPKENVMIGDTLAADIAPAKAFGIYTIGINIEGQDVAECTPDVVISDLIELRDIL